MTEDREIGWAIKMRTEEKYLVGSAGGRWWVADIGQAIMFLREDDAARMLDLLNEVADVPQWGSPQHVVVERVLPL